jgi:hypothetical protein
MVIFTALCICVTISLINGCAAKPQGKSFPPIHPVYYAVPLGTRELSEIDRQGHQTTTRAEPCGENAFPLYDGDGRVLACYPGNLIDPYSPAILHESPHAKLEDK